MLARSRSIAFDDEQEAGSQGPRWDTEDSGLTDAGDSLEDDEPEAASGLAPVDEDRQRLQSGGSVTSEDYQALVNALGAEGHDSPGLTSGGRTRRRRPTRVSSSPALGVFQGHSSKKSPLRVKPPFLAPRPDHQGFPKPRPNDSLKHSAEWNESHHLTGLENALLPQQHRRYFCRPQSVAELDEDLSKPDVKNAKTLLTKLRKPEVPPPKRFISADGGAPVLPERHAFGGVMRDRDKAVRSWNDRWQNSMSQMNDQCHPDHRAYFTQNSLFEASPSQQYRRYMDQEIQHGEWVPIAMKKAPLFPPLGGRLRGRSGTPIPNATI